MGNALIVIDVQRGFDDPVWGARNNEACEANIAELIMAWRAAERPVVFVRHDSVEPDSPLRPDRPGNVFKDAVHGEPDLLVAKSVHSSFHGTPDLHAWLQAQEATAVTICGITTNHCCETTARVACDLGYAVDYVLDATHTFDRTDLDGVVVAADEIARITATNLNDEFAAIRTTQELI